jgi:hypothetical protein
MPFLAELSAGHSGPAIPLGKRAYFQQRLRIRIFNFLLEKFAQAQKEGLNKNILARRIGRSPEVINRWLGAPSNLTIDSISDLLLGISAEEMEPGCSSPLGQVANNYSRYDDMASAIAPPAKSKIERASAQSYDKNAQAHHTTQNISTNAASAAYSQTSGAL